MEIEIKDIQRRNKRLTIVISSKTLTLEKYNLYRLGSPDDNVATVKNIIFSIYESLKSKNLPRFNSLIKKHKSLPIKLSINFWYDEFLDLVSSSIKRYKSNKLPRMGIMELSKEIFHIYSTELKYNERATRDIQQIIFNFMISKLVKAIEERNVNEFKLLLTHLSRDNKSSFSYTEAMNELNRQGLVVDLVENVAIQDIEAFIEPTPQSLYKRLFPNKNRKWDSEMLLCEKIALQYKPLYIQKMKSIKVDFKSDIWTFYIQNETGQFKERNLDFTPIYQPLRSALKRYFKHLANEEGLELSTLRNRLDRCKNFLIFIQEKAEDKTDPKLSFLYHTIISNILKIKYAPDLLAIKSELEDFYSMGTVKNIFVAMRGFFSWYAKESKLEIGNPFHKVSFRNLNDFTEHTEEIPQVIIDIINENLNSLSPMLQNAWIILMNSGMRISELVTLEWDWLYFDEINKQYQLKYVPLKQEKQRRIEHKDSFHYIYATPSLIAAFKHQLGITENLRKESGFKSLFIHKFDGIRVMYEGTLAFALNNIIKKNEIDFKFTSHMCRKSMIVTLLTEGHSVEEVAKITGQAPSTILQSYFGIQEKKIAEMEGAYFDEAFNHLYKPKLKNTLSEDDIEAIRNEIKLGSRRAPNGNGYCGKHVVFGPCIKSRCIGCRLLITTPEQIPLYQQLLIEQEAYINTLEIQFKEMGIGKEQYSSFRDYQSELDYFDLIKDGLNKLIDFVKEKIPVHEQSKYIR